MSTEIIPFEFEGASVRGIRIDGEPWFVLTDVSRVLEISNSRNASARLDDDEKGVHTVDTLGGSQEVTVVNESGIYNLIFGSRKPQAKRFRKWVTAEVLPAIRKTGRYEAQTVAQPVAPEPSPKSSVLKDQLIDIQHKLIAKQERIAQMEAEDKRLVQAFADILVVETNLSDEEIAHHVIRMWGGSYMPEWVAWRRRKGSSQNLPKIVR